MSKKPPPAVDPTINSGVGQDGRLLQRDVMTALENLAREDDRDERAPRSGLDNGLRASAQAPAPQLAVEAVDLGQLQNLQHRWGPSFEARHGLALGHWSFVVKAVVEALATVPDANVQLHHGKPQRNNYYDVAITFEGPKGTMAPVIRSAQRKGMAAVEGELARFARQVEDGSLPAEDQTGAVITLYDRASSGLMLSTAPLVPPQCLALAVHATRDRPVVVSSGPQARAHVAIRPMCYLSLSWDPRALNVELAARLLARTKDCLEHPERLLLEA